MYYLNKRADVKQTDSIFATNSIVNVSLKYL